MSRVRSTAANVLDFLTGGVAAVGEALAALAPLFVLMAWAAGFGATAEWVHGWARAAGMAAWLLVAFLGMCWLAAT